MLTDILSSSVVYIVTGYTDMRKGIDGLAQIVIGKLKLDAYSHSVFLFCGRNSTKLKALVWDGDGFLLMYKRLDNGRYRWPADVQTAGQRKIPLAKERNRGKTALRSAAALADGRT